MNRRDTLWNCHPSVPSSSLELNIPEAPLRLTPQDLRLNDRLQQNGTQGWLSRRVSPLTRRSRASRIGVPKQSLGTRSQIKHLHLEYRVHMSIPAIGYCVFGHDNDTYAFRKYPCLTDYQRIHQAVLPNISGVSRADVLRCEICEKLLKKWDESLAGLVVRKRRNDIGSTYDGITIVSNRFKLMYESSGLVGLVFTQLPDDNEFYAIRPTRSVRFDAVRRSTRFINACTECHRYESVVGATPVFLCAGETIGDSEFVRTDIEFGSDDEMSPLLLCGKVAGEALNNAKLKGVDLSPIEAAK